METVFHGTGSIKLKVGYSLLFAKEKYPLYNQGDIYLLDFY